MKQPLQSTELSSGVQPSTSSQFLTLYDFFNASAHLNHFLLRVVLEHCNMTFQIEETDQLTYYVPNARWYNYYTVSCDVIDICWQ